jgi:MerR family transcriptional regulator/heat shock protein HspR
MAERRSRTTRVETTTSDGRTTRTTRTTRVEVSDDRGVFMISVAAELAEMHPQTLRMYEARGLIEPKRSPKGTRLYSQADVERLRRIQEMTAELGMNLAGVERVFELETQIERMSRRMEALEQRAHEVEAEMAAEVERVRSEFRAELVPYVAPGEALVPAKEWRRLHIPVQRARRGRRPDSRP